MPEAAILWRLVAVATALLLVVGGIVGLVRIARAEWRREHPSSGRYLRVVARFALAFVLVVLATG